MRAQPAASTLGWSLIQECFVTRALNDCLVPLCFQPLDKDEPQFLLRYVPGCSIVIEKDLCLCVCVCVLVADALTNNQFKILIKTEEMFFFLKVYSRICFVYVTLKILIAFLMSLNSVKKYICGMKNSLNYYSSHP